MVRPTKPPDITSTLVISLLSIGVVVVILLSEDISGIWYFIALLSLVIVIWADYIYKHAKAYGRNAVAWATAFVFFSPLWAGIAYLLTWPKDAKLQTLEHKKVDGSNDIGETIQKQAVKVQVIKGNCPNCGSKIKTKGKFCPECGVDLIDYEDTKILKWKCEVCGRDVGKDDKFCASCGTELAEAEDE